MHSSAQLCTVCCYAVVLAWLLTVSKSHGVKWLISGGSLVTWPCDHSCDLVTWPLLLRVLMVNHFNYVHRSLTPSFIRKQTLCVTPEIEGLVTVPVYGPWGQKTGPDRTSKHYSQVVVLNCSSHIRIFSSLSSCIFLMAIGYWVFSLDSSKVLKLYPRAAADSHTHDSLQAALHSWPNFLHYVSSICCISYNNLVRMAVRVSSPLSGRCQWLQFPGSVLPMFRCPWCCLDHTKQTQPNRHACIRSGLKTIPSWVQIDNVFL